MKENLEQAKLDLILGLAQDCNSTLKRIESRGENGHINSVPSDDVRHSRVVDDVYVSSTITSVVENQLANSNTQFHEFSESTSDDVDVQVKSSTSIPTEFHTHDNDTSDTEYEPVVESTVTTFSYPPSSHPLEFFSVIHREVFDFSSFSGCLQIYPESNVPLTAFVAHLLRHPIYPFCLHLGVT